MHNIDVIEALKNLFAKRSEEAGGKLEKKRKSEAMLVDSDAQFVCIFCIGVYISY